MLFAVSPGSPRPFDLAIRQLGLALLCAMIYCSGAASFSINGALAGFLPFGAMAMVALLLERKHYLLGISGGVAMAQWLFGHIPVWEVALNISGTLIEAMFGAWLLRRYKKFDVKLANVQSFFYLFLVSLIVPVIRVFFLLIVLTQQQNSFDSALITTIKRYWMGNSLGIILFVMLLLIWRRLPRRWSRPEDTFEFSLILVLSFFTGQIVFCDWFHAAFGDVNRGYWMFLIILLAAVRTGRHGVSVILVMTALQAELGAAAGKGFFGNDLQASHLLNLWNYVVALTLVGMTFSVILKSRSIGEKQLRCSESRLVVTQQMAGIATWTWNLESNTHWWSPGLYEIFGRDAALGPTSYADAAQYFTPESWQVLAQRIERCMASGKSYECDAEVVRSDGSRRWVVLRGEVENDESGKTVSLHGMVQDITARKLAQLQLAFSEANFRALFDNSPTAMLSIHAESGAILQANGNAVRLWGYSQQELLSLTLVSIIHPDDVAATQYSFDACARGELENGFRFEKRYIKKDGSYFWAETSIAVVDDGAGEAIYNVASIIDISERRKIEQELRQLSLVVEQSPESIEITNTEMIIEYVNATLIEKSGYSREELIGKNPRILQSGKTPRATYDALADTLARGEVWEGEFVNRTKAGVEYIEHAVISPIRQLDGTITHYIAVKEDITEKIRSKHQLHQLAYFDDVTGLPNFVMLREHISQSLIKTSQSGSYGGLLALNIDRFKMINDANGQSLGNVLLQSLGQRLVQVLHTTDVVSRTSGDEFSVLFPDLANNLQRAAHLVMQISQKIHACLHAPFQIGGKDIILTACHGIALFSGTEIDSPFEVVRRANTALHHAKLHGCAQSVFFEDSLEQIVKQRFAVEGDLRQAITEGQFQVYLQSQVNERGEIKGAEALVRWLHPRDGMVSPINFIPIAEETNLIIDIDNWVLNEVCRMLTDEKIAGLPMRFSVNISARHFNQTDFVPRIKETLTRYGVDPNMLTLEVTEGIVIGNIDEVIAKMKELSDFGLHFSMDDFGTGYSSLSYLKRLPIHELKIDRSFIQDVTSDHNNAALVEVILSVARHLKLKVVAEGVETEEQAAFLNRRALVLHQGYLFSKPEPMASWIAKLG